MEIPDITKLVGTQFKETHFKLHYNEFYEYLINKYKDIDISFQEKLYWYYNGLDKRPVCNVCGGAVKFITVIRGYQKCCSMKCSNSDPDKLLRVKKTNIERYGVDIPIKSQAIKEKTKKTNLERYGVEYSTQNPKIKEKIFNTIVERYGGIGKASCELREKQEHTMMSKYGVIDSMKLKHVKEKAKQTYIERYGVENPLELGIDNLKSSKLKQSQQTYPDILGVIDGGWLCTCTNQNCSMCEERTYTTPKQIHRDRWNNGTELCTKLLPIGNPSHSSSMEYTIQSWLDEFGIDYELNVRNIIPPKELDIYIPSKNVAIECNGCYWHSDLEKPKKYHINKYLDCKRNGIQLIQIWEDWFRIKPDIVKSFLKSKLGICDNTIYARKCEIKEIPYDIAMGFLEHNHIQGKCSSNYRLGLFYNDELVSVMCFNKRSQLSGPKLTNNDEAELIRFCNKIDWRVVGGASKLLNHYIYKFGAKLITSYASNDISNGQLYKTLGFSENDNISESYWYIEPGTYKRYHRSIFTRSSIVKKWPEYDINDKTWTEHAVMDSKGYMRIYDSGTTRYQLNVVGENH